MVLSEHPAILANSERLISLSTTPMFDEAGKIRGIGNYRIRRLGDGFTIFFHFMYQSV